MGSQWAAHSVASGVGANVKGPAAETSVATTAGGGFFQATVDAWGFTFGHARQNGIVPERTLRALTTESNGVGGVDVEALNVVVAFGVGVQILLVAAVDDVEALRRGVRDVLGEDAGSEASDQNRSEHCDFGLFIKLKSRID